VAKVGSGGAISLAVLVSGVLAGAACGRSRPVGALSVGATTVDLPHSHAAALKLRWTPTGGLDGLEGNPRVFVHVLDGGRQLLRTFDHPLPEPWTPGRAQSYEIELYQSAIADPLPAGAYEMTLGLYDDSTGDRWPLTVEGDEVGRREYRLATVVVPAASAGAPIFEFVGGWLPVEPGGSRQVVARRCARGEATIVVHGATEPGAVRLALTVPKEAARAATVEVTASCTAERAEVRGPELQWISIPIAAAAAEPDCEIRLRPAAPATVAPENERSVCLEVLAWRL